MWCWVYRPIYMRYTSNSLTFTINLPVDELLSRLFMFVLLGNKSMIHHELLQIWWCNIQVAVSRILRSNSWFTFVLPLANQTLNMRCTKRKRKMIEWKVWLNRRWTFKKETNINKRKINGLSAKLVDCLLLFETFCCASLFFVFSFLSPKLSVDKWCIGKRRHQLTTFSCESPRWNAGRRITSCRWTTRLTCKDIW